MGKQTQRNRVGRTVGNVLEEGMKSHLTRSGLKVMECSANLSFWFSYSLFFFKNFSPMFRECSLQVNVRGTLHKKKIYIKKNNFLVIQRTTKQSVLERLKIMGKKHSQNVLKINHWMLGWL